MRGAGGPGVPARATAAGRWDDGAVVAEGVSTEAGGAEAPWSFPSDPRDGWEPGPPSLRALVPSAVGGGVVPMIVYFAVRPHVHGDAPALAAAGVPAVLWVLVEWVRKRTVDPIGTLVLLGFALGLLSSWALGGNAFVLKVRNAAFTGMGGLACLASARFGRRPLAFHIGKALSAGTDHVRQDLFEQLWDMPPSRAVFVLLTLLWGTGLLLEAATQVVEAVVLPTDVFVVANPVISGAYVCIMLLFTLWFSEWSRRQAERAMALAMPAGGGSTWWWVRHFTRRPGTEAPPRPGQPSARPG